mmetsp:Transcript_42948/g.121437  ORF Transcript_42948/g.121437 Transcript_42948/m.121437 type:complete len:300 (+) Transcript_42948:341-1240(+)
MRPQLEPTPVVRVEVAPRGPHVLLSRGLQVGAEGVDHNEGQDDVLHLGLGLLAGHRVSQGAQDAVQVLDQLGVRDVADGRGHDRQPMQVHALAVAGPVQDELLKVRGHDELHHLPHLRTHGHRAHPARPGGLQALDGPAVGPGEVPVEAVARGAVVEAAVGVLRQRCVERLELPAEGLDAGGCGRGVAALPSRDLGVQAAGHRPRVGPVVRGHGVRREQALRAHHRLHRDVQGADVDHVVRRHVHERHLVARRGAQDKEPHEGAGGRHRGDGGGDTERGAAGHAEHEIARKSGASRGRP